MTVASSVARGRTGAQRVMLDTGTITRPPDPDLATLDEATGNAVPDNAGPTTIYDGGRCALRATGTAEREEGGQTVLVETFALILPFDAPQPEDGDVFTLDSSALSPSLVGLEADVTGVGADDTLGVFRQVSLARLLTGERSP